MGGQRDPPRYLGQNSPYSVATKLHPRMRKDGGSSSSVHSVYATGISVRECGTVGGHSDMHQPCATTVPTRRLFPLSSTCGLPARVAPPHGLDTGPCSQS